MQNRVGDWTAAYPDFNVEDFSLQINGESQQGDATACFIDTKNTVITWWKILDGWTFI